MSWLEKIELNELRDAAPGISLLEASDVFEENDVVSTMLKGGPSIPQMSADPSWKYKFSKRTGDDDRPPRDIWVAVKKEINELICDDTEKYEETRKKLSTARTGIFSIVLYKISEILGVQAVGISGLVGLALFTAFKVGKNAYCESIKK